MIIPPFLKKGDKVGLIAPARKVSREEMAPAIETIKAWGFIPVEGPNLYGSLDQFSGSDEERTSDIEHFLSDRTICAVIACRGGYGALRIVDRVNWNLLSENPKWFCGYSDFTVFHSHINKQLDIATIHGTMPINFEKNKGATESLFTALTGGALQYDFPDHPLTRKGKAEAPLVGGNLSLLFAMMGSVSSLDSAGKILFIEDLDEYLYHIDRMIHGLKRAGMLKDLAGLVVGGMSEMKDNQIPFGKTAEEIIREAVDEYDYPVYFGFPAGHIDTNNALRFGLKTQISFTGVGFRLFNEATFQ